MRRTDDQAGALFSYLSPDNLVPVDHSLRAIRPLVNAALERLSPQFSRLYSLFGQTSIAREKLLRALLLQAFYGVCSERQLMEQVTCNMVFRWFIGLSMDALVWDVTVFTKNRGRLLEGDIAVSAEHHTAINCHAGAFLQLLDRAIGPAPELVPSDLEPDPTDLSRKCFPDAVLI